MIGKSILHYRILEKLGEGGMGIVYLAEDTKLDRRVAIKFLPRHVAGNSEERKRFELEAKAPAALNHPNIATIYAIEEYDEEIFIVMEFIKGRELHDIIRDGQLPVEQVVEIGKQIASGLQAAHAKGIVHRDIKSSNIMVTESGQIKIMDFGLVKLAGADSQLTKEHSTLGTTAYMSPEQTRGEPVDHRTDIWSLGVLLYQMLTGKMPFRGDYEQAIAYSIVNEKPENISKLNPEVKEDLQIIVDRAISKDPKDRYQDVGELLYELGQYGEKLNIKHSLPNATVPKQVDRKNIYFTFGLFAIAMILFFLISYILPSKAGHTIDSIAVLPFENFSGDQNKEYFADGMTEAIISNLAQINSLRVISRTSVMKYKNDGKSLKEIANELDVDAILEGSVVQDSNKARISVHLIDAKSEKHIWTKKYDRQLKDILTIQNKLSLDVTREVKIALTEEEETRLSKIQQINPNAHDAYLKGQYQIDQYTMGIGDVNNLKQGISYLQQSIEIDPKWAKAYAGLAYAYHWLASSRKKYEYFPMSKAAALKAIELDETNAKAHGSLAYVLHNYDWDWDGAAKEYKRANELNPNGFAWGTALFYRSAGFYKDAIRWYQRAIDRNPLSAPLQRQLGETYLYDGQVDQALEEINKSLELNPNNASARTTLADIYLKKNNFRSALEEAGKAYTISNDPLFLARLGFTDVRCNLLDDAQKILNRLKAENLDENLLPLAELYIGLGYKKKALSLVEQAFDNKSMELLYIKETVLVDSLGQNPSFQNILKKINFPITKYKI